MNTKHKTYTALSIALLAFWLPCPATQLQERNVRILNKEVKRVDDNVNVNMDIQFDNLNLKSNRGTVVIPMIVNQGDTVKLPAVEVMGRKRYIYYQREGKTATENPATITKYTEGEAQTVHYSQSTPYRSWMENSQPVRMQPVHRGQRTPPTSRRGTARTNENVLRLRTAKSRRHQKVQRKRNGTVAV